MSAALAVTENLIPALEQLIAELGLRAREQRETVKTGRTHLMDAMPVTVKQELQTWAMQLQDACGRVARARDDLLAAPQ